MGFRPTSYMVRWGLRLLLRLRRCGNSGADEGDGPDCAPEQCLVGSSYLHLIIPDLVDDGLDWLAFDLGENFISCFEWVVHPREFDSPLHE